MSDTIYQKDQLTPRPRTKQSACTLAFAVIALAASFRTASADTTLFSTDFDSDQGYTTGSLVGQNGWALPTSGYSVGPTVLAGTGTDTTNVIQGGSAATGAANSTLFTAGSLNTSDTVTLTLDIKSTNSFSIAVGGIGGSPATENATAGDHESSTFGEWNNQLAFYQAYSSTPGSNPVSAVTTLGGSTPFTLTSGDLYAVQSVWNLTNNTATLAYEDLTLGQTSFTSLFFGSSTTIAIEGPAGATTDPVSGWNTAYFRMSPTSNPSFIDNFSATVAVTSVPEPATYALLMLGAGFLGFVSYRRLQSNAFVA